MSGAASSIQNHNKPLAGKSALVTVEIHKSLLTVHKQRSALIA